MSPERSGMSELARIDPIAVEVIGKQLLAAAEEMGVHRRPARHDEL